MKLPVVVEKVLLEGPYPRHIDLIAPKPCKGFCPLASVEGQPQTETSFAGRFNGKVFVRGLRYARSTRSRELRISMIHL